MQANGPIDELARNSLLLASRILAGGHLNELEAAVLTLSEVAALLRVSETGVRRLAATGEIPGRLIEGEWRFLKSTVLAWLAGGDLPRARTASGWKEDARYPKEEWRSGRVAAAWTEETSREAEEFIKQVQDARRATVSEPGSGAGA